MGASITQITHRLTADFLKLVLVVVLIALPLGWFAMSRWLQGFSYRVELQWWMFAEAGLITVVIAVITVSGQSIRAAMADPTRSLKSE